MQKAISYDISVNQRIIICLMKRGPNFEEIICFKYIKEVPKWMQLPQPNHLNHVEWSWSGLIPTSGWDIKCRCVQLVLWGDIRQVNIMCTYPQSSSFVHTHIFVNVLVYLTARMLHAAIDEDFHTQNTQTRLASESLKMATQFTDAYIMHAEQ